VSPVRWLRAFAVVAAAALLLASSCTWQLGPYIPNGVPPPPGVAVPPVDTHAKGRPADQLRGWATAHAPALKMPVTALEAYGYAARVAEVENPSCHIAWTTLAGIGQVESHHGTYHHATLFPNGDVRPPIRGVVLDGSNGTLRIVDSEAGGMDDGSNAVRAMGPMQFIPETWREYGVDANNDGAVSVDNIDDAALSAAGYLCWRGKDLATPRGWITALRAYNNSDVYARAVRDWATAYAAGHSL
jgi:membrane-bound lytic murein transglycosylase B